MSACAVIGADVILAGPHIKTLVDTGDTKPVVICEPLQFVPVMQPDRDHIARCGECGYAPDHPVARVCTHSLCPRLHGGSSR